MNYLWHKWAAVALFLFLSGCQSNQIDPAVRTAAALRDLFAQGMTQNEQIIVASNPPAETFRIYMQAQADLRRQFDETLAAHVAHLRSLGQVSEAALALVATAVGGAGK